MSKWSRKRAKTIRARANRANWYELYLPPEERKTRGHFSTPPALVERILDACRFTISPANTLHTPASQDVPDLTSLRILDPACGGGNFLSAVVRRIVDSGKQLQHSDRGICTALQHNVWGFDPDPIACFLAEMQVRTVLDTHELLPKHLHIHQADGLAFPWHEHQEQIDLFLANPPYLATKNNDLSVYRSTQGRGQVDSYLLFLDLALRVVRPGGWMGLVLPDALLARANATRERQRLLNETTIHALWHLSGVFPAYVGAVVLVAQKNAPPHLHAISWQREKWYVSEKRRARAVHVTSTVQQSLLRTQSGGEFRYLLGREQHALIAQIQAYMSTHAIHKHATLKPLEDSVTIRRGEELGKASQLVTEMLATEQHLPLLRGGVDVEPYCVPHARYWLARNAITKPLERYLTPKLLVVKSTARLQATLDLHNHVVLQTLYVLSLRSGRQDSDDTVDILYYLLALLNSDLLRNYVYVLHTSYKLVQPQIEQHVLARLPVPVYGKVRCAEVVQRAKEIMVACESETRVVELKDDIAFLHAAQERAVLALYQEALDNLVDKGVDAYAL